jgi:hypothetical protein
MVLAKRSAVFPLNNSGGGDVFEIMQPKFMVDKEFTLKIA